MNLQQIISYRETCLICQNKLIYHIISSDVGFGLRFVQEEYGLRGFYVEYNLEKSNLEKFSYQTVDAIKLNIDGTFQVNELINISDLIPNFNLYMLKHCSICMDKNCFEKINQNSNVYNIRNTEYGYFFNIKFDKQNSFECSLGTEIIKYNNIKNIYYLANHHDLGSSFMLTLDSKYSMSEAFYRTLASTVNLNNIKNIEQYLNKFKTLVSFS